jgi:hypothetical protein
VGKLFLLKISIDEMYNIDRSSVKLLQNHLFRSLNLTLSQKKALTSTNYNPKRANQASFTVRPKKKLLLEIRKRTFLRSINARVSLIHLKD